VGSFKVNLILSFCLAWGTMQAAYEPNRILFLATQGQLEQAINLYEEYYHEKGQHQPELLQQIGLLILDKGLEQKDPELQLLAIFGAGISMNDSAFYILEEGMRSPHPQIQAVSLNFLSRSQQDASHAWLIRSLSSPYALLRLEAAYQLALQKHPTAPEQIEALMYKLDPRAAPLFPQLFALAGDHASIKMLKKMLTHPAIDVRVSALISVSQTSRDDLLPMIRKMASQHEPKQQEAAAFALGVLKDVPSTELLKRLAQSGHKAVQIAALKSLLILDDPQAAEQLSAWAKKPEPFAIRALGSIPGQENVLAELAKHTDLQVRLNATVSLLERKDPRALQSTVDILMRDLRDLTFTETSSPGRSLKAWRAVSTASVSEEEAELAHELSLSFKEELLTKTALLPENAFLQLAAFLYEKKRNDLIPHLTALLIEMDSPGAIALLKQQQQKAGAPLIRNFANLALIKLNEEGPYRETLHQWVLQQKAFDMMKFRAFVPYDKRDSATTFELTPQESARLMIEALEFLSLNQDDQGIDLLLEILKDGHPRNRFAAAGLLLRATQ
jgi:hypothetical protein